MYSLPKPHSVTQLGWQVHVRQSKYAAPCLSFSLVLFSHIYRPQRSWGKVMFLQASVILSTGGGSTWPGTPPGPGTPPWDQVHPLDQAPPQTTTPPAQSMLGDTVNARAVRILLECILVRIYVANYQKLWESVTPANSPSEPTKQLLCYNIKKSRLWTFANAADHAYWYLMTQLAGY